MNVLYTNDDGIDADGIRALVAALPEGVRAIVAAPANERSACSHSISLGEKLRVEDFSRDGVVDVIEPDLSLVVERLRQQPVELGTSPLHVARDGAVRRRNDELLVGRPQFADQSEVQVRREDPQLGRLGQHVLR